MIGSPGLAAGPVPLIRSLTTSFLGGLPFGTLTFGLGRGCAVAGCCAAVVPVSAGAEADGEDEVLSLLDPQPAATSATSGGQCQGEEAAGHGAAW